MKHERKFGKLSVAISEKGAISIVGDFNSNFGLIYPSSIERFKRHPIEESADWNRPQVIGMDWNYGLGNGNSAIAKWIYNKIRTGKFDHLINDGN